MIERLTVIGVGLIGSSLARALKRANSCGEIIGCDQDLAALQRARELGVVDDFEPDITAAVSASDMIVVAVPLGAYPEVLGLINGHLRAGAIVTDVGSAKTSVVEHARAALPSAIGQFVPGHPIAGTEKSGVDAGFAELFDNHRVILTPTTDTQPEALERVTQMWIAVGASVELMEAAQHDLILGATSHLPHVLAYALVDCLAREEGAEQLFQYAAGGFRDFTRIASSSPRMWHDILFANRDAVLAALALFSNNLAQLTQALETGDRDHALRVFENAKRARDALVTDNAALKS